MEEVKNHSEKSQKYKIGCKGRTRCKTHTPKESTKYHLHKMRAGKEKNSNSISILLGKMIQVAVSLSHHTTGYCEDDDLSENKTTSKTYSVIPWILRQESWLGHYFSCQWSAMLMLQKSGSCTSWSWCFIFVPHYLNVFFIPGISRHLAKFPRHRQYRLCKTLFSDKSCFTSWPYVPRSKLPKLGMAIPPVIRNSFNGYIKPYDWVDDHPLLHGNNGSLDPNNIKGPAGRFLLKAG